MKGHVIKMHSDHSSRQVCPWCGNKTKDLQRHLKNNLCNVPVEDRPVVEKVKCDQCGKMLKSEKFLKRHIKNVHERVCHLKCSQCEYKTNVGINLKIHIKRVHEGTPLKETCLYCGIETMSMDYHLTTYHGDKLHNNVN